jgi:predicted ATPase
MSKKQTTQEFYLKRLEFIKDFRGFSKGFSINFDSALTILVGENGSGKSTLLNLIRSEYSSDNKKKIWAEQLKDYILIQGEKPTIEQVKYFDFHSDDMKYASIFGEDISSQISAQRASSGQGITLQMVATGILKSKNSLLLIDEAARGYSPNMQTQFAHGIYLSTLMHSNQVILATHSEYIMKLSRMPNCKLYSVEHKKYMTYEEFQKAHFKSFE